MGNCPNCGYETEGLPSRTCPECGETLPDRPLPGPPRVEWRILFVVGVVAGAVATGYFMTFVPGVPRWWGPLPLTVVIPVFLLYNFGAFVSLCPLGVGVVLLNIPTLRGGAVVRWWSLLPVAGLWALSWFTVVAGAKYGVQYESLVYVIFCIGMNLVMTLGMVVLWRFARRRRYWVAASFHAVASFWLASYAFPYFGELP